MGKSFTRFFIAAGLIITSVSAWGQSNACDLNSDGKVDSTDVQAAINMSIGASTCSANIAGTNACNVVVVQRVVNAANGGQCLTSSGLHVVSLNWTASTSSDVTGYKVYRGTTAGSYTPLQTLGAVTSFMDTTVTSGQTYYYVITAVNSSNVESSYSSAVQAVVPVP